MRPDLAASSQPRRGCHPKTLAILAVEHHLALLECHPCTINVLKEVDYWKPAVSVLVTLAEGHERGDRA